MHAENTAAAAIMGAAEEVKSHEVDSDEEDGKRVNTFNSTSTKLDSKAVQLGRSKTMAIFDPNAKSSAVKKSKTILSPDLDILDNGSMMIEFDNMHTAHELGTPLCGRLKFYLQEDFEALNITLNLLGFCRSHFADSSQFGDATRLAKNIIDI